MATDVLSTTGPHRGRVVREWRALGTLVHLEVADAAVADAAQAVAEDLLDQVDQTLSRFRPDSELRILSARPRGTYAVSPLLAGALAVALEAAAATEGAVDPTMAHAMVTAGYDRTFRLLPADAPNPVAVPHHGASRGGAWRDITLGADWVSLPAEVGLDLGATGKAFAADLIATALLAEFGTPVLASVGGDVAVASPEGDHPWPVAIAETVEEWQHGDFGTCLLLTSGGLATSTTVARQWQRGGRRWHHLLDPQTGEPVDGPWRTVSAVGRTCGSANTASTAALVLGERALEWLEDHQVAARLIGRDGAVTTTSRWLGEAEAA